ncbi:MAG: PLP-dependent aminotransferase family protein [Mucilaginibacter sp.]|uniref:MocR-like pyridoxine biosynthesis transcription factor PdxR n=1 Tax=Mucilaginibacter sp. TaxID=1882438 RepID=UPI0031AB14AC
MLPYQSLIVIEPNINVPIYRQIAGKLVALIQSGKIIPGAYLPGTREMAAITKVHRNTVINAYNELVFQGWAEAIPKKGYQIISELPVLKPRSYHPEVNFSNAPGADDIYFDRSLEHYYPGALSTVPKIIINDGFPDIDTVPFEEIMREYRNIMRAGTLKHMMSEHYDGGTPNLKNSACHFLNQTRGLHISPENIMITKGAQMAIYLASAILLKPGDHVVTCDPNYFMADEIFRRKGAIIHRVPEEHEGMDIQQLEDILKRVPVKLLYIIPHHHHPTTVTMSANRRMQLLNLVEKYQLWIIEDDYDYDFHYQNSPILPLASADHSGRIIYVGSFTKLLGPSFRMGYLIGGKALIKQANSYMRLIDLRGDSIMECALASLIDNGELSRHINRAKKLYSKRCDDAATLISNKLTHALAFHKPQGGMALWLKFKPEFPLNQVMDKAVQQGLYLAGSAYFQAEYKEVNGIRFGFASLTEAELTQAVDILEKIVRR